MRKLLVVSMLIWFALMAFGSAFFGTMALVQGGHWPAFVAGWIVGVGGLWVTGYIFHEESKRGWL